MTRNPLAVLWGCYCALCFTLLCLVALVPVLLAPTLAQRRAGARWAARAFFRLAGLPLSVRGLERLPPGACVVVANHSSYVDGPLLFAALPPRFGFVIKKEVAAIPLAGFLLHRMGHEFVDRFNRHQGAKDTRRLLRAAERGDALTFFPEGTFDVEPGIRRFQPGAFVTAVRSGLQVVPVVIHGARAVLPPHASLPRRGALSIDVLEPLSAASGDRAGVEQLRNEARRRILELSGEPDLG
jgi:1-acyl-sn-glycerol-3-phosphate acyltransferase